jgi:hypothetical protein
MTVIVKVWVSKLISHFRLNVSYEHWIKSLNGVVNPILSGVTTDRNTLVICLRVGPKNAEFDWSLFNLESRTQQNAYIERYNRTVRYDWLAQFLFGSVEEVQEYANRWLWTYNHERPNMGLGGITPIQKLAMVA